MSIVLRSKGSLDFISVPLDGSTALAAQSLVYKDTTNGVVKASTSSDSSLILYGYCPEVVASGATSARILPITSSMRFECDCTNNTATNQLLKNHLLTDASTINNTASHSAAKEAVFLAEEIVGAAGDKKLVGRFLVTGIVTA